MGKKSYVVAGGYGLQYWGQIYNPDIAGNCKGLSVCILDHETGKLTLHSTLDGISNPGTLATTRDHRRIYCANEEHDFNGLGLGGAVTACSFDPETGKAALINQSSAFGSSSCYVSLDKTEKYLLLANHATKFYVTRYVETDGELKPVCVHDEGCICLFALREDGGIGKLLDRVVLGGTGAHPIEHASAHPHSILIDDQDYIVAPNKGGDSIWVGKLNRETEKMDLLSEYKSAYGSSPRYAAFVPGTDYVLGTNEFSGQVTSYSLDRQSGELTLISKLDTYDPAFSGQDLMIMKKEHPWAIDIQLHPNGRFIYADNAQNLILLYHLDRETGALVHKKNLQVKNDHMLRGLQISPDGDYLLATTVAGERVVVFAIDPGTGCLTEVDSLDLPTPTATRFLCPVPEKESKK